MNIRRVLLHNHSTWSDGKLPLETLAKWGGRLGVAAVVMSEHDYHFTAQKWEDYVQACRLASTARCTIIPGIEYSSKDDSIHVITMGSANFHGARRDLTETLASVREAGGAAVWAHPVRKSASSKITKEIVALLDAVEVWNRKVDGLAPVRSLSRFARFHGLATTVGMDLHTHRQVCPLWNEINSDLSQLSGQVIAAAIRSREIAPVCILGKLEPVLGTAHSTAFRILNATESCRRVLRDIRDALQPS